MADKDRKDKDRSSQNASGSHSTSSGYSFLPSIFGGARRPTPAPAVTSRISTSVTEGNTRKSIDHDHIDEPTPSRDKVASLAPPAIPPPRPVSPAPFDLEGAIQVMDPKSKESNEVLSQMVKATAVHLANLLIVSEDVFVESTANKVNAPTEDQLKTLYLRAYHLASPSSDSQLRIAAIRLLAALFATSPPPKSHLTQDHTMERLTTLDMFKTITTSSSDNTTSLEQTHVVVGALKALTKNGTETEGMSGLVGYLVKALSSITDEWIKYCSIRDDVPSDWTERQKPQPFAPIRPATAAEVANAIVDLLHSIMASCIALFGPADVVRVTQPMLDMIWLGMAAAPLPERKGSFPVIPGSTARRGSPASTGVSTPIISASLGLGLEPLRSVSLNRSTNTSAGVSPSATPLRTVPPPLNRATTVAGSPSVSPANLMRSPPPDRISPNPSHRWAQCFEPLCEFLDFLVNETLVADDLFNRMIALVCLAYGQDDSDMMYEEAWEAGQAVMRSALGRKGGRRGELAIRNILEGKAATISNNRSLKMPEEDRKITRGAVIAVRDMLYHPESGHGGDTAVSLAALAPSLRAAQSSSRFSADKSTDRLRWQPVDYEILQLLQSHLTSLQEGNVGEGSAMGDAWTEGQAVCDIMHGLVPVVRSLKDDRGRVLGSRLLSPGGAEDSQLLASIFESVIHQIPGSIGRLHSSTSTTPTFFHPRYIELLLELSDNLDEEDADVILDYYQREGLCLPFTSSWIQNIWRTIDAFYTSSSNLSKARKRTTTFILRDVYNYAEELTEHRVELVDKVILPFLERGLIDDDDDDFVRLSLDLLVRAAVAETQEMDRNTEISAEATPTDRDAAQITPAKRDATPTFDAIRALIIKVANQTACKEEAVPPQAPASEGVTSPPPNQSQNEGANLRRQSSGRTAPSALRGLMGSLSPTSRNAELPSFSSISHPMSPASSEGQQTPAPVPEAPPIHMHSSHHGCKSLQAVGALVSIFTQIAFAVPLSSSTNSESRHVIMRSITLYTDLLNLVYPMTTDVPGKPKARLILVPARCPRARLVVLQWFMRLRADNRHRLFIRSNADRPARSFAEVLGRTREKEQEMRTASEGGDARRSRHTGMPRMEEDRGRASRSTESGPRSRSRSKAPVIKGPDATYNPLWCIPTEMPFELPPAYQASEILRTYDPNHPAVKESDEPEVDTWLPVSDYLRMLNGVLRGHDWELVSFILSYLPLQLRNKTYFHGARATKEIRALLDVICEGIMDTRSPWEKRFNVPSFITRVKVNSVAYQTLAILISYHGVFTRDQCDRLIQALILGLQGRREVAKPCLQALTLCIYEVEQFVGRHLLDIVERMKMILSTPAIAVHVLEFLIALGQNGNLFRNFTDEQYRLVFAVATTYIGEHNARADTPSADREEYTLSQHVIGLAYYVIYIWFMALRLPQRPGHVGEIVRNILSARSQRVVVDEMAEVCFDWLARYTYGNADPRPATSFLNEVVIGDGKDNGSKSQSWLLGGAIITVTAHARTGWATIKTTRPTGTTALTCKVENVPMLEVGEANADLGSLLAVLMANRGGSGPGGEQALTSGESADVKAIFDVKSTAPAEDMATAQHGHVWSGATPSQRRKDVAIEPSYLALQLLSSYPNSSLETPRGRLIPQDEKFMRTLRGIENTPVIDTLKIGVLYVGAGQTNETEILSNIDGSPLYLDFLSGLGRLIRLKGQVDVFVGGLDRADDNDGEYAYAWWDDLTQMVFHCPTMMPNLENNPERSNKKRLVGNDFVKIIYNDSGKEFVFDTIRTSFNMINIVIAPHTPGDWAFTESAPAIPGTGENVDREDFFRVSLQRAPGIPDFSPIGEAKIVSRRALPIMVRHIAHLSNDLAARYTYIRDAADLDSAEYITMWRSRLRAMQRLRQNLPPVEMPSEDDPVAREELLRDFTRNFSYQPAANTDRD